ncbi:O-antigen ligase family protein [Candidatus Neomarinimicrobiota bacterium]
MLKLNINIWRIGIWLLPLMLGLKVYFLANNQRLFGYLIFYAPYIGILLVAKPSLHWIKNVLLIPRNNLVLNFFFYLLLIMLVIGSFRSTWVEYHSYARFFAQVFFIIVFILYLRNYLSQLAHANRINLLWKDLAIGLTICIVVNLLAQFLLRIPSPHAAIYATELQSRISFLPHRIHFPFALSTREFSYFGGLLVLISGYLLVDRKLIRHVLIRLATTGGFMTIGLLIIILTDSRMTLLMTIFFWILLQLLLRWRMPRLLAYGMIGTFALFPAVYLVIITVTGLINGDLFDITLTGRIYLWAATAAEFPQLGLGAMLFGNGMYGQIVTGLSEMFGLLFLKWENPDLISCHNASFQIILDNGLLGFMIYIGLLLAFTKGFLSIIQRSHGSQQIISNIMALSMLIYYIGLGTTEGLTPLYYESFLILLIILKAYLDTLCRVSSPVQQRW